MNKKAVFFSTDALIALFLIFITILVVYPFLKHPRYESEASSDMLKTLSSIKISEIDNAYVASLISQGKIENLNQTVLEQIGEFYAKEMPEAELLTSSVFSQLSPRENIGLWINNQLIFSQSSIPFDTGKQGIVSRQLISGIEKGKEVKGFSSRAFLTKTNKIDYFYFGGYVGDGNITALVNYSGNLVSVKVEIAINKDFDLYINNIFSGHYANSSSSVIPAVYDISAYLNNFHSGANEIRFVGNKLYIAGGYVKISYNNSEQYSQAYKHNLPGIEGIINLYDSFYVPNKLNSISIFLHYKSPYKMFFNIGNQTVFNQSNSSETSVFIDNSQLSPLLNYDFLSRKTIPIRIGLQGMQFIGTGNADVVLITDISGSMNSRLNSDSDGVARNCGDPLLHNSDTKRISLVKCLDKQVIDSILNVSGNRLALSAFYGDTGPPNKGRVYQESLTTDSGYLKTRIELYSPQGGTCICCAINDAYKILNEQSNSSRKRFIIVMSDGIPTHTCGSMGVKITCDGTRTGLPSDEGLWLGNGQPVGARCYGGLDDCEVNYCQCASQNANWSSCRAKNDLNATVYSIGFGPLASCSMANKTLSNIAKCGEGKYYVSDNATLLEEFYMSISREIVSLSYTEQEAIISEGSNQTILYPDSYISLNYSANVLPYGQAITIETEAFGNDITNGSFFIPADAEIAEANVVSYSGAKWTDYVYVFNSSWQAVFSLQNFGNNYVDLGDPYPINIPLEYLIKGDNLVKITTGLGAGNSSGGSVADKAIYTIIRPAYGYSKISSSASGCKWVIEFEDSSNSSINVPTNYSGSDTCYYTSSLIAYNTNDAINNALFNLLSSLDLNQNHKVETKFREQDLQISSSEISGIPYTWNSEVQVRTWR